MILPGKKSTALINKLVLCPPRYINLYRKNDENIAYNDHNYGCYSTVFISHVATNEEEMLQSALAMSVDPSPGPGFTPDNFEAMSEEQQIALALQMSLADGGSAMETDSTPVTASAETGAASADNKPSVSVWASCCYKVKL